MKQDKAFTYTIDKGNAKEQFNIKTAATSLKREMREVVTPFIDKYRFKTWATKAGQHVALTAAPTKSTIAGIIMDATCALDDKRLPFSMPFLAFVLVFCYGVFQQNGDRNRKVHY